MASYKTRAMVLKKTKLKEADLILTLLDERGSQIKAVAKGARKNGSTFSARLELFTVADLMLYKGKNLDTITEARCVDSNEASRRDIEHLTYGAIIAEFIEKTALEDQESRILFPLTQASLQSLGRVGEDMLPFIVSAYLLKAVSYMGYKPSFEECTFCGASKESYFANNSNDLEGDMSGSDGYASGGDGGLVGSDGDALGSDRDAPGSDREVVRDDGKIVDRDNKTGGIGLYSINAGGWVCPACLSLSELSQNDNYPLEDFISADLVSWIRALIGLTFQEIEKELEEKELEEKELAEKRKEADLKDSKDISLGFSALASKLVNFCSKWIESHLELSLKSLDYVKRI